MKSYQKYQKFSDQQTPMGIEQIPDQMKPIAYKNSRNQNFDIILNKFFNNGELTDIQLQQLSQHQKVILEEVKRKTEFKTKRPDEYQKLFYKKAFKFAQHAFFKKNKKNRSRRMSQFYHYHFDDVAKSLKIPLVNFYHPEKKTKPGLSTGQKSFNASYIKTILKSKTFRKVCIEYHEKFKQDCKAERNKKISTFVSSLFSMIDKSKDDIKKLIRFLQSSKCKIPWSDRDIDEAYKRAEDDLDDFGVGVTEETSKEEAKVSKGKHKEESFEFEEGEQVEENFDQSSKQEEKDFGLQALTLNDEIYQNKLWQEQSFSDLSSENGFKLSLTLEMMNII